MLKRFASDIVIGEEQPSAAFGRLCVETIYANGQRVMCSKSAAFGRLCVETTEAALANLSGGHQPPSGGCVLKQLCVVLSIFTQTSAAFGRLCVETTKKWKPTRRRSQPPSGGCVLKQAAA